VNALAGQDYIGLAAHLFESGHALLAVGEHHARSGGDKAGDERPLADRAGP